MSNNGDLEASASLTIDLLQLLDKHLPGAIIDPLLGRPLDREVLNIVRGMDKTATREALLTCSSLLQAAANLMDPKKPVTSRNFPRPVSPDTQGSRAVVASLGKPGMVHKWLIPWTGAWPRLMSPSPSQLKQALRHYRCGVAATDSAQDIWVAPR